MFAFYKNWKARLAAARFTKGKEFAKADIMRDGDAAIEDLENHVECFRAFGDYDEFDRGVEEAIRDYQAVRAT